MILGFLKLQQKWSYEDRGEVTAVEVPWAVIEPCSPEVQQEGVLQSSPGVDVFMA